jgi:hypothetical protein
MRAIATAYHERRSEHHIEVSIAGRLELPSGVRPVRIVDFTNNGARLQVVPTPAVGAPVLLKWDAYECFSTVVWAEANECGVQFERSLSHVDISCSPGEVHHRIKPVATLDKIRNGAKRRQARVLHSDENTLSFAWWVALRRPCSPHAPTQQLTLAETMFFYGAPVAHLLAYEEEIKRTGLVREAEAMLRNGPFRSTRVDRRRSTPAHSSGRAPETSSSQATPAAALPFGRPSGEPPSPFPTPGFRTFTSGPWT